MNNNQHIAPHIIRASTQPLRNTFRAEKNTVLLPSFTYITSCPQTHNNQNAPLPTTHFHSAIEPCKYSLFLPIFCNGNKRPSTFINERFSLAHNTNKNTPARSPKITCRSAPAAAFIFQGSAGLLPQQGSTSPAFQSALNYRKYLRPLPQPA